MMPWTHALLAECMCCACPCGVPPPHPRAACAAAPHLRRDNEQRAVAAERHAHRRRAHVCAAEAAAGEQVVAADAGADALAAARGAGRGGGAGRHRGAAARSAAAAVAVAAVGSGAHDQAAVRAPAASCPELGGMQARGAPAARPHHCQQGLVWVEHDAARMGAALQAGAVNLKGPPATRGAACGVGVGGSPWLAAAHDGGSARRVSAPGQPAAARRRHGTPSGVRRARAAVWQVCLRSGAPRRTGSVVVASMQPPASRRSTSELSSPIPLQPQPHCTDQAAGGGQLAAMSQRQSVCRDQGILCRRIVTMVMQSPVGSTRTGPEVEASRRDKSTEI